MVFEVMFQTSGAVIKAIWPAPPLVSCSFVLDKNTWMEDVSLSITNMLSLSSTAFCGGLFVAIIIAPVGVGVVVGGVAVSVAIHGSVGVFCVGVDGIVAAAALASWNTFLVCICVSIVLHLRVFYPRRSIIHSL